MSTSAAPGGPCARRVSRQDARRPPPRRCCRPLPWPCAGGGPRSWGGRGGRAGPRRHPTAPGPRRARRGGAGDPWLALVRRLARSPRRHRPRACDAERENREGAEAPRSGARASRLHRPREPQAAGRRSSRQSTPRTHASPPFSPPLPFFFFFFFFFFAPLRLRGSPTDSAAERRSHNPPERGACLAARRPGGHRRGVVIRDGHDGRRYRKVSDAATLTLTREPQRRKGATILSAAPFCVAPLRLCGVPPRLWTDARVCTMVDG